MAEPMLVWVTRSSPYNMRTAHRLRALGHQVLTVPALQIRAAASEAILGRPDGLVFTSSHGVRHHLFQPELRDVPVFAVGDHSADAARRAGYRRVSSARGNVLDLQRLIAARLPAGSRLVHLGAEQPAGDLPTMLGRFGYRVERQIVYRSDAVDAAELLRATAALAGVEAIVVHSPRGAAQVAEVVATAGWQGRVYCISPACAAAFDRCPGLKIEVARRPNEAALLAGLRLRPPRRPKTGRGEAGRWGAALLTTIAVSAKVPANDNDRPLARQHKLRPPATASDGGDDPPPSAA